MATKTIKSKYLGFLDKVLKRVQLTVEESLARRRFLKLLAPANLNLEVEQKDVLKTHCEKDEMGNLKVADGEYVFRSKEQRKAFEAVMNDLLNDDNKIDFTGHEADLETTIKILKAEVSRVTDGKKDYNADDFEYTESLSEVITALEA